MLESFFNKVAGLKDCNFTKETLTQVFSCEYGKIWKNTYFKEHLRTAASVTTSFDQNFFALNSQICQNSRIKLVNDVSKL